MQKRKNYGRPLSKVIVDAEVMKEGTWVKRTMLGELMREPGLIRMIKLLQDIRKRYQSAAD
jgi:hypothetical protein